MMLRKPSDGGWWERNPQVCGKTGNLPLPAELEQIH
jgi:hypothetical protein